MTSQFEQQTAEDQDGPVPEINVRLKNITKLFEDDDGSEVTAVKDLSLDVYDKEFLVLVGPSGCGKTTTLRMIAGLEDPTQGIIEIQGDDVTGLEPRQRDIAMVFQNYALYPHKTVRKNISFPLEVRGFPKEERKNRTEETARILDITELLSRKPSELSGGQQQRVALGRAIVRQPVVFLMDEPLSNLDAKLRLRMRTELNELHNRVDKTTIYVTHDQAEAMTLGDRVAVMNQGELQQVGAPQDLYENPENLFVAGFLGEPPMNFFSATLEGEGDTHMVNSDFTMIRGPPAINTDILDGENGSTTVTLGVRPEDFSYVGPADTEDIAEGEVAANVRIIEPMGSDIHLNLTTVHDDSVEFTARVDPSTQVNEGDTIRLAIDTDQIHLFDQRSGDTLLKYRGTE